MGNLFNIIMKLLILSKLLLNLIVRYKTIGGILLETMLLCLVLSIFVLPDPLYSLIGFYKIVLILSLLFLAEILNQVIQTKMYYIFNILIFGISFWGVYLIIYL